MDWDSRHGWSRQMSFAARLVTSPKCIRCGDVEKSNNNTDSCTARCTGPRGRYMAFGTVFDLESNSVCSNVSLSFDKNKYYVFLYLLAMMLMIILQTQKKWVHRDLFLSYHHLLAYNQTLKMKEYDSVKIFINLNLNIALAVRSMNVEFFLIRK